MLSATEKPSCSVIPINDPKWECYTLRHGEGLDKISASEIRANTPKWESSLWATQ
jgi:hypothetical protein